MSRVYGMVVVVAVVLCGVALAGPVGGVGIPTQALKANGTDVYTMPFVAGKTARIEVCDDGDGDLDVYVFDNDGVFVAKGRNDMQRCVVEFTPPVGTTYTV